VTTVMYFEAITMD